MRLERNDPCFCGSGKKYKKCHLLIERVSNQVVSKFSEAEESCHSALSKVETDLTSAR